MKKTFKVRVKIKSINGECPMKFKVGQTWVIDKKTPGGMCQSAYNALYSALRVFRFGGRHPWDKNSDVTRVACPDPDNQVIFELKRLK